MCRSLYFALTLLSCLVCAMAHPASWMSGKWGVGLRTPGGGIAPPVINNLYVPFFNVTALVEQVKNMGASWLIINLSSGASGDTYISYHPVLYEINPGSTPANVSNGGRDLFGEIATALNASGIACIAYTGAEGPAMLKAGASKAYDVSIGSPSVTNWKNWVQAKYGASDDATLKVAYAKEIAQYYANRYGDLINGWWFDQSNYANIPLLRSIVKTANPNTVAIFNDGVHVPLFNSQPGLEDATAGVPSQLTTTLPNSYANYPMITSVENSSGWLNGSNGELALGHVFMPFGDSWNAIGTQNVWNQTQAADWMGRVLSAGGAWTWNLPRQNNGATNQPDASVLSYSIVNFVKNVVDALPKSPTKTPTIAPSFKPSVRPTVSPSSSPTSGPTKLQTKPPTIAPTYHTTLLPSYQPSKQPVLAKHSLSPSSTIKATSFPSKSPTSPAPTSLPTSTSPTFKPTKRPSVSPTGTPSIQPSALISSQPSFKPTNRPTHYGRTSYPSFAKQPTDYPSSSPTQLRSSRPTGKPSSWLSEVPSKRPTVQPTQSTNVPTKQFYSQAPSVLPTTRKPSFRPTLAPTALSKRLPTSPPTKEPPTQPVKPPTTKPTTKPTASPTVKPTSQPTRMPTLKPTKSPTAKPTAKPTQFPTSKPTKVPTNRPTVAPSKRPSSLPTRKPTQGPTFKPTSSPTMKPTAKPSAIPIGKPTTSPSRQPTNKPSTSVPTFTPTVAGNSTAQAAAQLRSFVDETCLDTLDLCGPNKVTFCHKKGKVFMTMCLAEKNLKSRFGVGDYCGCCSAYDAKTHPTYCDGE